MCDATVVGTWDKGILLDGYCEYNRQSNNKLQNRESNEGYLRQKIEKRRGKPGKTGLNN